MDRYDSIIIGGGHNGLICATYLAQSGQRVLLLEAASGLGGLAANREFHPGFHTSVAHSVSHFSSRVVKDLNLASHGLAMGEPLATVGLNASGDHVVLERGRALGVEEDDAAAFHDYKQQLQRFAGALEPFWHKTMPGIGGNTLAEVLTFSQLGLKLRLLGKEDMLEFLRVIALPMRDLMDENFDNEQLKAILSWEGLIGSRMAPRSPNHSVLTLLYRMAGEQGGAHAIPAQGVRGLIAALEAAAQKAGVEIRTGAAVKQIQVSGDESGLRVAGVELEGGEMVSAERVVSSCDPQTTFLKLVGARHLEIEFTNRIRRLRSEGFVAKLHLALTGFPQFTGLDSPGGRMILAPEMDAIEFAYDDAKYGGVANSPVMEVLVPSIQEPSLAPDGQHVLSAHVMYVPAQRKGGWTEEAREQLLEALIAELERYCPELRSLIAHAELLTPHDIEQQYRVTGGHWHHTEFALDQALMMRPTYEAAQYGTPVPGLLLCGAGSHPGGGLMGAPGYNAAREILK